MNDLNFTDLGLTKSLVEALTASGFTTPTPIQAQAIPVQLQGQDVMGIARTGSGKTAAFGLPLLAHLMALPKGRPAPKSVGALVLAPTRELAVQIEDMLAPFAKAHHFSSVLVLGGVSRQQQIRKIARGIDIMIATPGRLLDLLDSGNVRLDQTGFLVLDEADRMLDMGFVRPVKKIAAALNPKRQTVMFSATMADEVAKLAHSLLKNPVRVEVEPQGSTAVDIAERVVLSPAKSKRGQLNQLLASEDPGRVIVFSRTKHGANRIAKNLEIDGHAAGVIHGNKSQNARQAALNDFRAGRVGILVATDIAARGIDVPGISHVINFDLPDEAESYVHRIGRTGRNGAKGVAISLVDPSEKSKLRAIERLIRKRLPAEEGGNVEAFAPREGAEERPRTHGERPGAGKRSGSGAKGAPKHGERKTAKAENGERAKQGKPRWNKKRKEKARAQHVKSTDRRVSAA